MMRSHCVACWLLLAALSGCQPNPAALPETPVVELAGQYRPDVAGVIAGQVLWTGPPPAVEPFSVLPASLIPDLVLKKRLHDNVNAPVIDPVSRGVGNAVIYLRGVSPATSRPWNLPPVQVAVEDDRLRVRQGTRVGSYGFVRCGTDVELMSRDADQHLIRAGGAAFFTLAFPEPGRALVRKLPGKGVVELSNATALFWMRAYLFVDEHPYYACTDEVGRFVLRDVPPGRYEVVCWQPNWRAARRDLDPEQGVVLRLYFQPPVEKVQSVTVAAGKTQDLRFELATTDFVGTQTRRAAPAIHPAD